jgi:Bacterial toxin 5
MVFFDYDGSGRVLDKAKIDLPPSRQAISGDKYNSFFYNSSREAIGNVPTSSFAATRASLHANFGIGFTPVSPTYPSSQPSSYAVVAGDTLANIAKSFLGDAQLWYLIADANGLTAGPTDSLQSQVGRSLRIPNVVTNVRNNADTLSPYNPNTIISNMPWVGAPLPPPGPTPWEQSVQQLAPIVGMATSMVLGVTLSGLGPLGAGIAAAAGDVVNQSIQIGLGGKDLSQFDFGEAGEAGLTGVVAGGLSALGSAATAANGGGLAAQALAQAGAAAATYAVNSSIHEAFHLGEAPASFSGWSLLTATAGAGATPVLGGFFSRLAQHALYPKTGWVWHPNARAWDAFYQELVMGVGQVVIQDSFDSPRHNSPKPEQRSQPTLPAELIEEWDEMDRQFDEAKAAPKGAFRVIVSNAKFAPEHPKGPTLEEMAQQTDEIDRMAYGFLDADYIPKTAFVRVDGVTIQETEEKFYCGGMIGEDNRDGCLPLSNEYGLKNEIIEMHDVATPAEIRSKQGIANVQTLPQFRVRYNYENFTRNGLKVPPRTDEYDAKLNRAFVKYRVEESIPIERSLRITAGNASLGISLATMELGMGAALVTAASIWANPWLFVESNVVGYAADKVVTNVTGSETLGTIAGFAAGGVAAFGRVGATTVAETLAVNRARNTTVVLLKDGTTLYRGIPRAALDAKVGTVGTEAESTAVAIAAARSSEIAGGQLLLGSGAMTESRALGVPATPGRDFYVPGPSLVYEPAGLQAGVSPMFRGDALRIGGFEPKSPLVASIGNGTAGLGGGGGAVIQSAANQAAGAARATIQVAQIGNVANITSRRAFRRFVTRTASNPNNELYALIDSSTGRLRRSTAPGLTAADWLEDPRIIESGHFQSAKILNGSSDRLVIISAYENRLASATIEHPSVGGAMMQSGDVVLVGGLPIDLRTAQALVDFGALDAKVLAAAPKIIC